MVMGYTNAVKTTLIWRRWSASILVGDSCSEPVGLILNPTWARIVWLAPHPPHFKGPLLSCAALRSRIERRRELWNGNDAESQMQKADVTLTWSLPTQHQVSSWIYGVIAHQRELMRHHAFNASLELNSEDEKAEKGISCFNHSTRVAFLSLEIRAERGGCFWIAWNTSRTQGCLPRKQRWYKTTTGRLTGKRKAIGHPKKPEG